MKKVLWKDWEGTVTATKQYPGGRLSCYVLFDGGGGWFWADELIEKDGRYVLLREGRAAWADNREDTENEV